MSVIHSFAPGDFLIFQLESGYGLLRVTATDELNGEHVWHVAAYRDLFLDVEMADVAIANPQSLTVEIPHVALTNRAFESTQVSRIGNATLNDGELSAYETWKQSSDQDISDRSIRLLLGLR